MIGLKMYDERGVEWLLRVVDITAVDFGVLVSGLCAVSGVSLGIFL